MKSRKPEKAEPKMPAATTAPPAREKNAALTREIQERIGQQLRAMYNDVVSEGIPDKFNDLLRKLDKRDDDGGQG